MSFGVLFVCTGNICRSPMAERLLRAGLPAGSPISVASAGTMALVGHPLDASCAIVLGEYGVDSAGHVGRRLTKDLIASADLILTAQMSHRSDVLQTDPLALRRTFTLREFVRLNAGVDKFGHDRSTVEGLRSWVAEVAAQRGTAGSATPAQDEIADPFGAPIDAVRSCAAQIAEAVDALILAIGIGSDQDGHEMPEGRRPKSTVDVPGSDGSGLRSTTLVRRWLDRLRAGPFQ